ncbi:MAG: hypothetical protein GXO86_13930 [Chlorobi bacterium]|nr:hypothetical protein [Chlorobiota bacterium]
MKKEAQARIKILKLFKDAAIDDYRQIIDRGFKEKIRERIKRVWGE